MTTTLPSRLAHNAATKAGGVWLTSPETRQTVTWAQAQHTIQDIVGYLHQLGLRPGEPVAIAAHNCIASALLFTAITSAGYLGTPLNLVSGTKTISYVLGHCQAKVLFCAPENKALMDEVLSGAQDEILIIPLHPETGPIWPENLKGTQAPTTNTPHPDSKSNVEQTESRRRQREATAGCW